MHKAIQHSKDALEFVSIFGTPIWRRSNGRSDFRPVSENGQFFNRKANKSYQTITELLASNFGFVLTAFVRC